MKPETALEVRDISVYFGSHTALEHISHTFTPGVWTHIIGPNGAGKSTLLKSMCGLIQPAHGSILFAETDLFRMPAHERAMRIAYVPQRLDALPALRAADFVAQGTYAWFRYSSHENSAAQAEAAKAMHDLGIESFADRQLNALSGGEIQLCVLASAMAQKAQIILLDEPASALDIRHAEILALALKKLTEQGITIISTTHDLRQAARFADETILIKNGHCLWTGKSFPPPECLCDAYEMPASYFDFLNDLAAEDEIRPKSGENPEHAGTSKPPSFRKTGAILSIAALILVLGCPWIGATTALPTDENGIFWMLRIPRVLWGALAGATLAMVGGVLQALFQNPLATPYTLGIASGASLGAMAAIQLGISAAFGLSAAASAGGLTVMALVLMAAQRAGLRQPMYCLLAGVAASMFCSAAGLVIQAFATPLTAQQMMRWQLGGLEIAGYSSFAIFPVIAAGLVLLYAIHRPLELLSVDFDLASARGVNANRTRMIALAATGIVTSFVVAICGPIGFIGLIIPNAIRQITGARLRYLLPMSALAGASFLMLADTAARVLENIAWIPAGVVTAILGAPVFIYAMLRKNPRHS